MAVVTIHWEPLGGDVDLVLTFGMTREIITDDCGRLNNISPSRTSTFARYTGKAVLCAHFNTQAQKWQN